MIKRFLFAFLLVGMGSTLVAQYEVSVTTIPVWVRVQDKSGNPILGLTQEDFEVFEDDKYVATNCFEEINWEHTEGTTPGPESKQVDSRPQRFVIFLDLYNTSPREFASIKPALQEFLESLSADKVEVMLAALLADRRLGVISRFTTDMNRVRALLEYAKANAKRDVGAKAKASQMRDALQEPDNRESRTNAVAQENSTIDGYQTARILAAEEIDSSRFTLKALETFAEHLARLDLKSHTSLILVSGGFSVDPGRRYFNMAEAFANRVGEQNTPGNPQYRQTGFSFNDEMQQSIGKLNRLNVTLYTLDTRGAATEAEFQDSLIQIARETGGLSFYNSDNFQAGLEIVENDLKHQYLLCYSPPEHKALGKYHSIRVNVKRSGITVRHRDGYWD